MQCEKKKKNLCEHKTPSPHGEAPEETMNWAPK